MELPKGRWTTGSRRLGLALSVGSIAISALASALPAQAHEPWAAKAWGLNNNGQLGDGTSEGPEKCGESMTPCSTLPVEVHGLSGVTAVAGGEDGFSLALLENGTVMAWGANSQGELGNGTTSASDTPVAVCAPGETAPCGKRLEGVTAISAGRGFSLALLSNGTVVAWGQIEFSGLGDGTTEKSSDVPVGVCEVGYAGTAPCPSEHFLKEAHAIAAGARSAMAVFGSNNTVVAWGTNTLGNGGAVEKGSNVPVAVCAPGEKAPCAKALEGAISVAAGRNLALALSNGKVLAWGSNEDGQLGNGTTTESNVPAEVKGLTAEATAIAAGGNFALALLQGGNVEAWGGNGGGQLGTGASTGPEMCGELKNIACSVKPVAVSGLSHVAAIAAGKEHSLALLSTGPVMTWGMNTFGQLGSGSSMGPEVCPASFGSCSTKPVEVHNLADTKGVGAGGLARHSLAFGPPPPTVTAISPNQPSKKGTTKVTITGSEFEEATEVKFGAAKATSVAVKQNGTIIEAVAPAGKGTVDVTVTTPAGTSASSEADRFYYSKPAVKKVSPKKGPELGGTTVTISGTNLSGVTAVRFGSTNATSFKVNSETSITAVSPAHAAGKVDVTVSGPNGTSAVSGKDRFRYK